MPFEQKYSTETRDASLATILKRRESEPGNRAIIRETAEQFDVGEQSLRGWIRAYEKGIAPEDVAAPVAPAPVASSPAKAAATPVTAPETAPRRSPGRPSASAASEARVSELEAEVAKLRRDREALKSALAVLLDD